MTGRTSLGSIFAGVGALAVLAGVRLPLIRTGPLPGDLRWTAVYRPGADPGLAGPYDLLVVALLVALVGGRWLATSWLAPSGVGRLVAATVTAGGGAGIGLVALWYAHASGYLNLFGSATPSRRAGTHSRPDRHCWSPVGPSGGDGPLRESIRESRDRDAAVRAVARRPRTDLRLRRETPLVPGATEVGVGGAATPRPQRARGTWIDRIRELRRERSERRW